MYEIILVSICFMRFNILLYHWCQVELQNSNIEFIANLHRELAGKLQSNTIT